MTPYKRGDVVLVAFPFTDLTTSKMRPALVISSDPFNQKYRDIILAAITSQVPKILSSEETLLSAESLKHAGLPKPSIIKLGKIVTLDQLLIRKKLGNLPNLVMQSISSQLNKIIG